MPDRDDVPLASLAVGDCAVVARVSSRAASFLRYLGSMGIYPGAQVQVLAVAPFDGPLTAQIGERQYAIGRTAAAQVFVRAEKT